MSTTRGERLTAHGQIRVQGWRETERDARRVRALSGLPMMPRGQMLVDHVTEGMRSAKTAQAIAAEVGYRVDRCVQRLCEAGHAPLARDLMERDCIDRTASRIVLSVEREPEPEPEPEPEQELETWARRPPPTADELLWELESGAVQGLPFEVMAEMFDVKPQSLRRRIERLKIADEAREHYPWLDIEPPLTEPRATGGHCRQGHPLYAATPASKPRCRICGKRYRDAYAQKRAAA